MRCPKCGQQFYLLSQPCRLCEFNGNSEAVEQWNHITWLLAEVDTWQWLYKRHRESVQRIYTERQKALEIELGLRRPPFTDEEAHAAWSRLSQAEQLSQKLGDWLERGWLNPVPTQALVDQTKAEIAELQDRLAGHARSSTLLLEWEQLSLVNFLIEQIEHLAQNKSFVSLDAKAQAMAPLLAEQEALELKLGLRPEPMPIPEEIAPVSEVVVQARELQTTVDSSTGQEALPPQGIPEPTPKAPPKPAVPFRERLWQMLLSERALQGMLFLGIFLLFSAALSFVAWGWEDFSAPLRVAIPTGFTGVFFALGWYVRTKTPMYRSGIALSAIAALLVPIDFYTVYVNFHIPPNYWPLFWLTTSIVCLIAYTGAALIINSRFFGYLVGTAAGSVVLALIELGHQQLGISTDWQSSGLSFLALGLIVLSTLLAPSGQSESEKQPWRIFSEPFRYLSLLTVGVIMLLTFGWRFTQREGYDTLHYALTLNWWLGGFIFGWGAIQYRSRSLGLLAAMTLPGATYLAQAALFHEGGVSPAWHAFGWALLVPLYLIVGYKLLGNSDPVIHSHGRTATGWGVALILIAMLWPLTSISDGAAASASHITLAGAVVLAAFLWWRPGYLYWASLLSFSAMTFAMTELNLSLAQLSVGWASLAIAHLILALSLGTRFPIPFPTFATPLVTAGYLIAAVALVPPLFPYQGGPLVYALANWIALAGWGAYLAHQKQPGFIGPGVWRKPIFHWLTALPLPVWVWVLFTYWRPVDATFPLALASLAWAVILLSYRLQRVARAYRWPWYLTGLLISLIAPISAFVFVPTSAAPALALLLAGLLYLTDAVVNRQSLELAPGGLVTGWGYLLLLDWLQLSPGATHLGMAGLIALYFLGSWWASRRNPVLFTRRFLQPLYLTAHFFTAIRLVALYATIADAIFLNLAWPVELRLWGAGSQLLLGLVYAFYTWTSHKERWGHLAAWLSAGGFVFLGLALVPPATALATLLALVAFFFILGERALYETHSLQKSGNRQRAFLRFTWRLYHRPLQITAWVISGGAIGMALLYNVWGLRGGSSAESWAVVALLLVTSLYALSAWLFGQTRFVWLAAYLSFAPWTLLTHLGWWLLPQPGRSTYLFSWALLAWLLFSIHLGLKRLKRDGYGLPLRAMVHSLLLLCVAWNLVTPLPDSFIPALGILAIGLLYFTDAIVNRQFLALVPGEILTTWGCFRLVGQFNVSFDALNLTLTLLVAFYILTGLWVEYRRYKGFDRQFLTPLYLTAHLIALVALGRIYLRPLYDLLLGQEWTDEMRLWGAAGQLILGLVYSLYSWSTYRERWGHVTAWLGALSGGFIALAYSSGRGSSAAKVALLVIAFILAERGLHWLRGNPRFQERYQARIQLAWPLYRRPLLITGWTLSGVTILLALVRNLWLLGGGWIQQVWAAIGLSLIVALYALSARLFRQPRFLWLAAPLVFAPWTILTHLGWFTPYRPTLAGYALSWAILSWLLLLIGLSLKWQALPRYATPLTWVAQGLMPFSLLWGIADIATSRFTFALAVGFYMLSAWVDHRQGTAPGRLASLRQTKYFYPTFGFFPIWSLYLAAWFFPEAGPEHYGLLLLLFAPPGLNLGQWLSKVAARPEMKGAYGLPAYLVSYLSLSTGTLLVLGQSSILAPVLLFDALLLIVSARLFKQPAWLYPAVILLPLSLLISLSEAELALNRYGFWLIGLSSIYLGTVWLLRRLKLPYFATAPLAAALALIALSLPFSSLDQTGALWGYGGAVLLYALTAFWLGQPALLTLASALIIVPCMTLLERSALPQEHFGLALFLGAILAWAGGWLLDNHYGAQKDFPWGRRSEWLQATIERLVGWWAFSPYLLGFALAVASPLFVQLNEGALTFLFFGQALLFGWAIYRFRLRGWLVGVALSGHLGVIFLFEILGWWADLNPAQIGLRLFPLTTITLLGALAIEKYRGETPRTTNESLSRGWSYPLYIIGDIDLSMGLIWGLMGPAETGAWVTLLHAILLVFLASARPSSEAGYLSLGLIFMALTQWITTGDNFWRDYPIALAVLAFIFGLVGYGLALLRQHLDKDRELRPWLGLWELPLQRSGLLISFGTLVLAGWLGLDLVGWTLRALLGLPFRELVEPDTVRMSVGVLSFVGLLYLAAALAHQWARLGYLALGMLLSAWMFHILFVLNLADLRQLQWYVIPVGLYLAGIAYLEWHQGNKNLSRWLDYVTIVGLLGTLFWQTLLFGWGHALLLGGIGLLAFFWGIGRRLRRFLYAGMVATMLATVGQLVNSFWSINQWIVFGLVGTLLILIAIIVERKLEDIKIWQEVLESWE